MTTTCAADDSTSLTSTAARDPVGVRGREVATAWRPAATRMRGGLGRVHRGGDLADPGQHLRVVAHPGRVGVRVVARPRRGPGRRRRRGRPARCRRGWPGGSAGRARSGRGSARSKGSTWSAGTRTLSKVVVPLPVPFWPKPSQSSHDGHARGRGVDDGDGEVVVGLVGPVGVDDAGVDVGPLGEDAAGRVVLRAVEAVGRRPRADAAWCAGCRSSSSPTSAQALPAISPTTKRSNHTAGRDRARAARDGPRRARSVRGRPAAGWRRPRRARSRAASARPGSRPGRRARRAPGRAPKPACLSRRTASTGSSPSSSRWSAPARMSSSTGAHSARRRRSSGVSWAGRPTTLRGRSGRDSTGGHGWVLTTPHSAGWAPTRYLSWFTGL